MPEIWRAKCRKLSANFVQCQRQINELFYQCEWKQHEENFQQLDSSFWCYAAFSSKLPDASLGADWTRLKTLRNWADVCWCKERRMWHYLEAEASLLSKWRLLQACSINRDKVWCIWKLVVRCMTFFAGVLWKQTCMSSNFADFYARSTALWNFPEFHHQVTMRYLFSELNG